MFSHFLSHVLGFCKYESLFLQKKYLKLDAFDVRSFGRILNSLWQKLISLSAYERVIAWSQLSISGVFLVRVFSHSEWIRARKTPNTITFHAVGDCYFSTLWTPFHSLFKLFNYPMVYSDATWMLFTNVLSFILLWWVIWIQKSRQNMSLRIGNWLGDQDKFYDIMIAIIKELKNFR